MSGESQIFTFEQTIEASPDQLYRAFTNATAMREWLADMATTLPRVGGRFYLAWNDGYYTSGEFTHLVKDQELAFTWHGRGEPTPTTVEVSLEPDEEKTLVVVKHSGLGTGVDWSETISALEAAWPFSLENLNSIMTTGEDQRFTRRPMLGITISDFNADIAAQLGVPVSEGMHLDGTVAGMGAEAAGLQADDVIVGLAGQDVVDWPTLENALRPHQAGDSVAVVFYRGPDKHTATMTLSGRPIPEIPTTAVALAAAVRKRYDEVEAELENFFAEVSDTEANFKPTPEAWNVKETLAHLIQSERDWHNWMANMIGGHEPWYDDWGGNIQARVAATAAVYPDVKAMLEELKRHQAETVAMVANLPADFVNRKSTYWRLAYNLLEEPYHHRAHMDQMRETLEKARQQ